MWLLLLIFLPIFYIWFNRWSWTIEYWEFKDIHGPVPSLFLGNILPYIRGKKSLGELCLGWAKEFKKHPLVGIYTFMKPILMINRLDYVETVLMKEFNFFIDRRPSSPTKTNISDLMLFTSTGSVWKALRNKLIPLFTSDKLKSMTQLMNDSFQNTSSDLDKHLSCEIDSKQLIETYVIDITANIGFGLKSNVLSQKNSEFRQRCYKLTEFNYMKFAKYAAYYYIPTLSGFFKGPFMMNDEVAYFHQMIGNALKQRRESGERVNDFIQLLVDLKEKGRLEVDNWDDTDDYLKLSEQNRSIEPIELTEDVLISQALAFITTGFDTVSNSLTFALTELGQNQRAMGKVVDEVDRVMKQYGDFTYEALNDMKYMEMCLMESMRLHPAQEVLTRQCVRNYTFDNGHQVESGFTVLIPVLAIHMDPDNYSEPDLFKPERFESPPKPLSYLPFGDGQRTCIAQRFAMLEMKMFLSKLLYSYKIELSSKTRLPIKTNKWNYLTTAASPVYFKVTKRNH